MREIVVGRVAILIIPLYGVLILRTVQVREYSKTDNLGPTLTVVD